MTKPLTLVASYALLFILSLLLYAPPILLILLDGLLLGLAIALFRYKFRFNKLLGLLMAAGAIALISRDVGLFR
jgi:uncharacterized membrane protein SpoIIM required for sporulation